jgi:hypothetical protein
MIAYSDDLNYPRDIATATTVKEMFLAYRNQYLEWQLTPSDLELIHQPDFKPQETVFKSQLQDVNQVIFSHLSTLEEYNEQKNEWTKLIERMSEKQIPELEARFIPSSTVRSVTPSSYISKTTTFSRNQFVCNLL